jgi:hypothetical protein
LRSYDLAPRPSPSPLRLATHRNTEKERQLAPGRGGERGGRRAESSDRKKAWSSINHSILSGARMALFSLRLVHMCIPRAAGRQGAAWDTGPARPSGPERRGRTARERGPARQARHTRPESQGRARRRRSQGNDGATCTFVSLIFSFPH